MNPKPVEDSHPLDLDGLEDFLDRAQLEVVDDRTPVIEESAPEADKTRKSAEAAVILDLMTHLLKVNDLLVETNQRLNLASNRLVELDEVMTAQSIKLEKMPVLEARAAMVEELTAKLSDALAENDRLKNTWVNKFFSSFKPKN